MNLEWNWPIEKSLTEAKRGVVPGSPAPFPDRHVLGVPSGRLLVPGNSLRRLRTRSSRWIANREAGSAEVCWSSTRPCVFFVQRGSLLDVWDLTRELEQPVRRAPCGFQAKMGSRILGTI